MMENVRVAILTAQDTVCGFMDNSVDEALHFYDDLLHNYLEGTSNTFDFKASAKHPDSEFLAVGNKLSFRYNGRDYYMNIMNVKRTEYAVEVRAYGLVFELLNETTAAYKAPRAMSFEEYVRAFNFADMLTVRLNEVADKRLVHEWSGSETILARLFSLANVFSAEVEFVPVMNPNYTLNRIEMNVYKEHTDGVQGIGRNRSDEILRYGLNVKGVTKTSDITELYTAIRPFGRDGLTVRSLDKKEYDADGRVEFESPQGSWNILAVQAKDAFPSNTIDSVADKYICKIWDFDTDNVNTLYGQALAELKKLCVPKVTYEIEGYTEADIGDTFTVQDEEFAPVLYLSVRISEQEISFTEPSRNKTRYSNVRELTAEVSDTLLAQMDRLIRENKSYSCSIVSTNGVVFKNGKGSTTLTACVRSGAVDVTDDFSIRWFKDGEIAAEGKSLTVAAGNVGEGAVFRFEADDGTKVIGQYEVTLSCVYDGEDGPPGKDGDPGKDGRGIAGTQVSYQASESGSVIPAGTWSESPPEALAGRYLWTRVVITYTDETSSTSYSVVRNGTDGVNGSDGVDGQMLYANCGTAAGTAAKAASLSAGRLQLKPGTTVAVRFTYENTAANPTLDIDGTGARAVYVQGVRSVYWAAGATVAFTYDGANWRVASEPVYASEAVIGNRAFKHVYIGGAGVDVRKGGSVLASFRDNVILLGAGADVAEIQMLANALTVGTVSGLGSYIKGVRIQIGVKGFAEAGNVSAPNLYIDQDGVFATNRSGGSRGRILTENGNRELLWSGTLGKGGATQLPNANWSRYNIFLARTSDGTTAMVGGRFDNGGLAYIRFAGGYDDGSNSFMFKANTTIHMSNNVFTNISCSKHKYLTSASGAGQAAALNLVALWGII
ncbi:MAG: hypothetical protein HFH12_10030 [Dorea sp.]|nr:hypothetical protein [Dorea sp.]